MENFNKILKKAKVEKYAIPQFNINNLEWAKYILEECQKNKSPVILGVSEGTKKYIGSYDIVSQMVKSLIKNLKISIPVVLHLDHGSSFESCKEAIDAGFTSVMIDVSSHSLEENIKITKEVVKYSKKRNVSVEGEIGYIGGTEDGISNIQLNAKLEDCIEYVNSTKVNALAPALGSVHGLYKGEPNLDYETMNKINNNIDIPLVLHGGTGIDDEKIKLAIINGISKININTELQVAWSKAVRSFLLSNNEVYDPRKIISSGEKALKEVIKNKVILFGSYGKGE